MVISWIKPTRRVLLLIGALALATCGCSQVEDGEGELVLAYRDSLTTTSQYVVPSQPETTYGPNQDYQEPSRGPRISSFTCPPYDIGRWDWYRVEFGYRFSRGSSDIIEFGVDYGDGRSYVTKSESDAIANAYWHKYMDPGTFTARAWLIDARGERANASCQFSWDSTYSDYDYDYGTGGRGGAVCNDGTTSSATGSGACSWHGGVAYWT